MQIKPQYDILYRELKNFVILLSNKEIKDFKNIFSENENDNLFDIIDNIPQNKILEIYNFVICTLQKTNYNEWQHRHESNLPNESCQIAIIKVDSKHWEMLLCDWIPYNESYSTCAGDGLPNEGYLGTAYTTNKDKPIIGFHAWKQNESEFIWYKKAI